MARGAVFLSVLASAATLEAMILDYGGHHSPYLIGLVLVAFMVLGLIPTGPAFAALLAATIFAVYLGPILAWDTFDERGYFTVEALLFAAVLGAGVLASWLHRSRHALEIGLRYDLTLSRERLEQESAQRARAVAEQRGSRELLSSIAAAVMDAIVLIDPEGKICFWNVAASRIFEHTREEAAGRAAFALLAAPERSAELEAGHRAWLAGVEGPVGGRRVVTRGRRSSGETFPMELAMSSVEREGRHWTCLLLRDVSEQTRREERLRLFAAAVEGAAEGFYIVGLDGRILYVNPAVRAMSGNESSWHVGRQITELHQNPAQVTGVIMPAIMRAGSWAGEVPGRTKDGRPLTLWLAASLVRDDAGRPIAMVGITKDLTGQRRLDEERIRAQKLESIGVLAGGLAHDFNNLLTIILGNLDLARLFAGASPDAAEALDHASEAALRAGDLTRQLITFSKGGRPVKRVGSLVRTVRETVAFAAAGSGVSCAYELPEDLPAVEFDEGQMRQVFHNLVQNAREAMPDGGTLRVSACALELAEGEVLGLAAGRYLRLDFRDSGSGIDREHLALIFDPYFSTKEMDAVKGRGLGLAVSFSIVRNHGGTMTADSAPAAGTTISVFLPESTRAPEDDADGGDRGDGRRRRAGSRDDHAPCLPRDRRPSAPPRTPRRAGCSSWTTSRSCSRCPAPSCAGSGTRRRWPAPGPRRSCSTRSASTRAGASTRSSST